MLLYTSSAGGPRLWTTGWFYRETQPRSATRSLRARLRRRPSVARNMQAMGGGHRSPRAVRGGLGVGVESAASYGPTAVRYESTRPSALYSGERTLETAWESSSAARRGLARLGQLRPPRGGGERRAAVSSSRANSTPPPGACFRAKKKKTAAGGRASGGALRRRLPGAQRGCDGAEADALGEEGEPALWSLTGHWGSQGDTRRRVRDLSQAPRGASFQGRYKNHATEGEWI